MEGYRLAAEDMKEYRASLQEYRYKLAEDRKEINAMIQKMSDEAAEDRKERKAFWSRIEENNERSDAKRKTDVINELNDSERNNRRRLLEKQTFQDSTKELIPIQEPVQEKAKNKRKRQSTLCEEEYELRIKIFRIDKFNCRKGMTESQKKDSIQLIKDTYQDKHTKCNFKSYKTLGTNRLKEISNLKFKDTRSRHRKLIAVKKRMLRYTI